MLGKFFQRKNKTQEQLEFINSYLKELAENYFEIKREIVMTREVENAILKYVVNVDSNKTALILDFVKFGQDYIRDVESKGFCEQAWVDQIKDAVGKIQRI